MLDKIFNSQSKTVTFAAILLAGSAIISGLLGLIRDRLLAGKFGAGEALDVYFAAFRIPDFVYGILIMSGISAVFLPVFAEYFNKNKEKAWELTNNVLNCFLILLILLCGILAIFTPWLIKFVAPGFGGEQKALMISLTRIMFLSPIFFGLSSVFSGILHYFNRFLVYSLAPILYNLGIIFGILFFVPLFGLRGLAYGVILGAFCHLAIQIPAARNSGYRYLPFFNFKYPGLVKIFKLMFPRTIGATAYHINLIVITAIASTLVVGSIAIFNFSNNLQNFPIGLIGSSFAIAAFPALSRAWANGQKEKFLENFSLVFRQILFLIIPISLLTFLLRAQIVRLILGTGQFGWIETRLTAACLGLFCFGIFAFTFIPFLARTFYSFQDTKTPVLIGITSMGLNIILCFFLVWLLSFPNVFNQFLISILKLQGIQNIQIIGLPLALLISGIFQFSLLLLFLRKKIGDIKLKEIWKSLQKILFAGILLIVFTYLTLHFVANFVNMQTYFGVLTQTILAGLMGIFIYILITFFLKSPEIKTIKSAIFGQFTQQ
ncbi:MAG: murein biosynthesis integral membrane protein MurJ [Candidatus Nealsonbacteria bacterium CG_4_9_14_0_2_um_filter_37_38]|uniref:Probable lipid II flippase MurJ n=1 Tax=Candidatus Nealsonbacteria bacterium CG_4_10_14_0_8_um_filter_37_14 TaxID=1974684 RepID=A0A2M7R7P2_9BACT|nr:MAG: murein biosynthesis integral membrane protein MurJ [Candidatus Nealsonbacteria bacterium CG11_big_fil_rev_8_21_14_0_20_37_68]PIW91809.1 MAG: murein biosynthesis integral membrane protein MurJ [Candidatus Nealsonbacteria bacterium CG_4_8_14_3_um_filter_37_23]PIY89476.1 MAG: murein biosynthesis integral membrane protein MurJ [Candidatus Nealsonbacteria bacterium CG_4_10_14_0_8_um_filter_37_14]PJC51506.1 MAG: murein biosynthesis integral membrane protein MurJ [Candidatus Nealsonbacteria bac